MIVAMANYQRPRVPAFAGELAPEIVQLHSSEYRNPGQLRPGGVLVAGAGNSGAEIALELCAHHETWLAGRDTGHVPFRIDGLAARVVLIRAGASRPVPSDPDGRDTDGPRGPAEGAAHRRTADPRQAADARCRGGSTRCRASPACRTGGRLLADGRVLDVANVVWCTGFHPGFSWIDLPVFGPDGEPRHERGIVPEQPGLYFVGLHFLYAFSSTMIHGVGRDAARIADAVAARQAPAESGRYRRGSVRPAGVINAGLT